MAEPHISTMSYHVLKAQAHFNLFKKTVDAMMRMCIYQYKTYTVYSNIVWL